MESKPTQTNSNINQEKELLSFELSGPKKIRKYGFVAIDLIFSNHSGFDIFILHPGINVGTPFGNYFRFVPSLYYFGIMKNDSLMLCVNESSIELLNKKKPIISLSNGIKIISIPRKNKKRNTVLKVPVNGKIKVCALFYISNYGFMHGETYTFELSYNQCIDDNKLNPVNYNEKLQANQFKVYDSFDFKYVGK